MNWREVRDWLIGNHVPARTIRDALIPLLIETCKRLDGLEGRVAALEKEGKDAK